MDEELKDAEQEEALDVLFPKSAEVASDDLDSATDAEVKEPIAGIASVSEVSPRITEALQTAAQLIRSKINALNSDNTLDGSKKGINIVGTRLYIMGTGLADDMDDFARFLHLEGLE